MSDQQRKSLWDFGLGEIPEELTRRGIKAILKRVGAGEVAADSFSNAAAETVRREVEKRRAPKPDAAAKPEPEPRKENPEGAINATAETVKP